MVMAFSTGKGVAATLLHTLIDAGLARYEDRVADHWPEFAAAGKDDVTIRQVLSHRAGLYRLTDMIDDFWHVLNFDEMARRVAAAHPAHRPGEASGYHAISFSWLAGELIQRIGKGTLAALLEERIVKKLNLDGAYFGLPDHEFVRCAELVSPREPTTLSYHALGAVAPLTWLATAGRIRLDDTRAALLVPSTRGLSWNDRRLRSACLPSSTGVFTARSLARVYTALLDDSLLKATTRKLVREVQGTSRDRVTGVIPHWRLGYHGMRIGGRFLPEAFGHCGYRGTGSFADPNSGIAFAYVHNAKAGLDPLGGGRFEKLAAAVLRCAA
jgi:CubicO group peptidase (beta-lactamase class C family)